MRRYTYTLNPIRKELPINSYKRNELEKMTVFHLREICRKEHFWNVCRCLSRLMGTNPHETT